MNDKIIQIMRAEEGYCWDGSAILGLGESGTLYVLNGRMVWEKITK